MSKVISELMFYSLDKLKPRSKTKKLRTKIFFVGVNENSTTSLYTFNRADKKNIFFKVYNKVEMLASKKFGF